LYLFYKTLISHIQQLISRFTTGKPRPIRNSFMINRGSSASWQWTCR